MCKLSNLGRGGLHWPRSGVLTETSGKLSNMLNGGNRIINFDTYITYMVYHSIVTIQPQAVQVSEML